MPFKRRTPSAFSTCIGNRTLYIEPVLLNKLTNNTKKKTTDQLEFRGRDTENREEFEINTSRPTTQNNLITNAGFTKRRELGKQMCLTLSPKFFTLYEKNTLKLGMNLSNMVF